MVVSGPKVMVGLSAMEVDTPPEKPLALEVFQVPLMVTTEPVPKVWVKAAAFRVAPLFTVSGTPALNVLATFTVMIPVLAITTPPVAANGVIHSSAVAVLAVAVLY